MKSNLLRSRNIGFPVPVSYFLEGGMAFDFFHSIEIAMFCAKEVNSNVFYVATQ